MKREIQTICLRMALNLGSVNCYLIDTGEGFILIDTGLPSGRKELEKALEQTGCRPGNLQLIVLTHGDFDHTGSAAYLRRKLGAKIAMHPDDFGMAERADMFWNRGKGSALIRAVVPVLFGFTREDRFTPDVSLQDGMDLSAYGFEACVLSLPGHSKGSIGVLMNSGDLFCGDLLMNDKAEPYLGFGDPAAFAPSVNRLKSMTLNTIYPGHGKPFSRIP